MMMMSSTMPIVITHDCCAHEIKLMIKSLNVQKIESGEKIWGFEFDKLHKIGVKKIIATIMINIPKISFFMFYFSFFLYLLTTETILEILLKNLFQCSNVKFGAGTTILCKKNPLSRYRNLL